MRMSEVVRPLPLSNEHLEGLKRLLTNDGLDRDSASLGGNPAARAERPTVNGGKLIKEALA